MNFKTHELKFDEHGLIPADRAGREYARSADARLHECRESRANAGDEGDLVLVTFAQRAVAQGRDVGEHAAGRRYFP